jgi:hypothetical protein
MTGFASISSPTPNNLTAAAAASLLALGVVLEASLAVCELRITLACAREQQRTGAADRARDGRATVHRKSNDWRKSVSVTSEIPQCTKHKADTAQQSLQHAMQQRWAGSARWAQQVWGMKLSDVCFALLCFALLCFALLCFALLCFARLSLG